MLIFVFQSYKGELYKSSIWGPTCDSLDQVKKHFLRLFDKI